MFMKHTGILDGLGHQVIVPVDSTDFTVVWQPRGWASATQSEYDTYMGSPTPDTGFVTEAELSVVLAAQIAAAVAALVNGAPGALDTLNELAVQLQADEGTAATLAALVGTKMPVVVHGATASTARPTSTVPVLWVGSVTPTNATNNDLLVDTATPAFKVRLAGSFTTLGGGGGGTSLTVQDEGGALTTAADTLNFVGAGVTATGTGATKTVTIPGGTTVAFTEKGAWATATPYVVGDVTTQAGARYVCSTGHTSGTFATDLAAAKWVLVGVPVASPALTGTPLVNGAPLAASVGGSTPLDGLQILVFGHSYATGTGASNLWGYMQRLAARFSFKSVGNRAVSGATSFKESTTEVSTDISYMATATLGLLSDCVYNDIADAENATYGGSAVSPPARAIAKFKNAKSFLMALNRRSGSAVLDTAGSYTGSWTANTGDASSISYSNAAASTSHSTTTQNDSVTFSGLTAGAKIAVILQGIDDSTNTPGGAAYSITAAGMTTVTGTTSNQFYRGRDTPSTRAPMPVLVTLPAGVTSLTITKTDSSGTVLYVNALLYQLLPGTSNWTVFMKAPYTPSVSNTNTDTFNAALDAVVTAHGNGGEVLLVDPNTAGWDKTTMIGTDNIHPNDRGHGFLLGALQAAASTLTYGSQRNKV